MAHGGAGLCDGTVRHGEKMRTLYAGDREERERGLREMREKERGSGYLTQSICLGVYATI